MSIVDAPRPTPHQEEALAKMRDWWNQPYSSQNKNCVLSAPAGCGKTFLAKYFVAGIQKCDPLFTATTNEAARQLSLAGVNVFGTTHKALGLTPRTDCEIPYFSQGELPSILSERNLLIIDEASMAGKAQTENDLDLIVDYVNDLGMKVLWLGDSYQLPPVESTNGTSPVFEQGWLTVELSQVMRNSGDILAFCTSLREMVARKARSWPRTPKSDTVMQMRPSHLTSAIQKDADLIASLRRGDTRIIAWRNNTVDRYNSLIRSSIFGREVADREPILVGDQILFTAPAISGTFPESPDNLIGCKELKQSAAVNARAEVMAVFQEMELYGIPCRKVQFRLEEGVEFRGYCLTESGVAKMAKLKKAFIASLEKMGSKKKADSWKWWHALNECFCKFKHSYAITAHRSQGSNIPNVIVDVRDILSCAYSQPLLAYKLAYTACSRSKKNLTLVKE